MTYLTDGRRRVGGGGGAKSYAREKAWSSINYSILCGGGIYDTTKQ